MSGNPITKRRCTMIIPRFSAEVSIYRSPATYSTGWFGISADDIAVVQPQFLRFVRLSCGPCVNGKQECIRTAEDCTITEGAPGHPEWGIPPGAPDIFCEPIVLEEFQRAC